MMNPSPSLAPDPEPKAPSGFKPAKLFYVAAAALMLALAFVGFSKFYLQGRAHPDREIPPPIKMLVIAHGVSMTLWMLLLMVQPVLILRGSRRTHMMIGRVGAGLAGVILILGLMVAIRSASVTPPETVLWGLSPKPFMAIPFFTVLIFAVFVSLGVLCRGKPRIHRSMMMLATLSVLSAAVSRTDPLNSLYLGTVWERLFGPFFLTLVIGVLLLIIRCALTRSLDRWFAIGLGALIAASALIMQVAPTAAWARFTSMVVG
ncbi:MAG: hypothetical protein ACYSXF_07675 [Planctomycetota bacterium]|jgi:hypothetical protein